MAALYQRDEFFIACDTPSANKYLIMRTLQISTTGIWEYGIKYNNNRGG